MLGSFRTGSRTSDRRRERSTHPVQAIANPQRRAPCKNSRRGIILLVLNLSYLYSCIFLCPVSLCRPNYYICVIFSTCFAYSLHLAFLHHLCVPTLMHQYMCTRLYYNLLTRAPLLMTSVTIELRTLWPAKVGCSQNAINGHL